MNAESTVKLHCMFHSSCSTSILLNPQHSTLSDKCIRKHKTERTKTKPSITSGKAGLFCHSQRHHNFQIWLEL